MLLPILLAALLLPSQQAAMRCNDRGSESAATQTQPLRGPGGVVAVLKVSSADDHGKNTHLCSADYVLLITPADAGAVRVIDLLASDADWGRTLSLRLDGFAHDGKRVFGVLTELGEYPSTIAFAYDTTTGKVQLIDLKKEFAHVVTARCNTTFGVAGTTATGGIIVELNGSRPCAANGRWLVNPTDGSVHRLPRGAYIEPLFTSGVDVGPAI
jgi:hypothetical protein